VVNRFSGKSVNPMPSDVRFKGKMHQVRSPLGFTHDPAGRAYSVTPDPVAVVTGPTSKRREGVKGRKGRTREEQVKGRGRQRRRGGGICWSNDKLFPTCLQQQTCQLLLLLLSIDGTDRQMDRRTLDHAHTTWAV